ncbi:MAG: 16S rRNA (cytidine(1402)-2'-O)-methyltransferase, partial [Oleiphilaceae bacterium]|nr:16S rRNA (cytidine(1402)-2'-O)-methyltransferase [Oleiphilaceae bacterium]
TRHTRRLLDYFGIDTPMTSLHDHNEKQKSQSLLARVRDENLSMALVSDAGTPLISDPGYVLVAQARAEGFKVVPVPGACALIAALSVSGIASNQFAFDGFLPHKKNARMLVLEALAKEARTVIYYESTHRIVAAVADLAELYPARRLCLARELTKRFEQIITDNALAVYEWLMADDVRQKGEFVLIVEGVADKKGDERAAVDPEVEKLLFRLLEELPPKQSAAIASDVTGVAKKELYNLAVAHKSK